MTTDHLLRKYAPIPAKGWQQIDDEAKDRLTARLAARRLVDWSGPHGWTHLRHQPRPDCLAGQRTAGHQVRNGGRPATARPGVQPNCG